jgi:DNA-binding NarL/FixJ family response regulator
MRTIILADNQDISKAGCRYLLEKFTNVSEIKDASTKKELITLLIEYPESLVILDYTLFDFESVNDLSILQMRFEKIDWILFSDELSDEFIRTVLYNTQSFSVLMKDCSKEEIISCIKESLKGNRYIGNSISNMLLDSSKNVNVNNKQVLTITEQEILKEMALGKTTKEIANLRHVSSHTIMTHRKNIFRKISVNNVHEATKFAMRSGIVDMAEYHI